MQNLFRKYLDNQCSPEELKELLQHFNAGENEILLRSLIAERLELIDKDDDQSKWTLATDKVYVAIKKHINGEKIKVVPVFRKRWFQIAAAAVLILCGFVLYNMVGKNNSPQQEIVKTKTEQQDIAPGGNKAVLTLADGSQIILDSAANGNLASQGNAKVIKLDGQLAYNTSGSSTEVLYNTITTPKGGQYQLVLADGSKVWLNAASSLRYPATFSGNERKVELTGEGYFEIAKNSSMPFRVNVAGKSEVEVLGTHFNINAYSDEVSINTTLLEGIVKVSATGSGLTTKDSKLLSPGQQAQQNSTGQIAVKKNNDIDEVMAWKNGKFIFQDADIQSIMRQIERWYDVEVSFNGNITKEQFVGLIPRNVNISQILKMLEKTGTVKFEIVGKKVIVK
jgi:transmembrane sensor